MGDPRAPRDRDPVAGSARHGAASRAPRIAALRERRLCGSGPTGKASPADESTSTRDPPCRRPRRDRRSLAATPLGAVLSKRVGPVEAVRPPAAPSTRVPQAARSGGCASGSRPHGRPHIRVYASSSQCWTTPRSRYSRSSRWCLHSRQPSTAIHEPPPRPPARPRCPRRPSARTSSARIASRVVEPEVPVAIRMDNARG